MNGAGLDPHVEMLRELWKRGDSCSVIAKQVNHRFGTAYSRNAVIGKASRLHLPMRVGSIKNGSLRLRATRERRSAWMRNKRRVDKAKKGNPVLRELLATDGYVPPAEEIVIPVDQRKTLQQLEDGDCRFPIGDPQHADFHFCARPKVPGLPYCDPHSRRCFAVPVATAARIHARISKEKVDA